MGYPEPQKSEIARASDLHQIWLEVEKVIGYKLLMPRQEWVAIESFI
jgi:hypothetical protein